MNERAIRKLRIKFMISATTAYMAAMLFMGGLVYATNAVVTNKQINSILSFIAENKGEVPDPEGLFDEESQEAEATAKGEEEDSSEGADTLENFNSISMGDIFATEGLRINSPDFLYSLRFFSVLFDAEGEVVDKKMSHISSVSEEDAVEIAKRILHRHFTYGSTGIFSYKKESLENQSTIVVCLDSRSQLATSSRLLYSTLIILGFGFFIVLTIVRLSSYQIIQPEIQNAKRQEQFITNASHELKTPLAVIRANTEVEQLINGENEWNQSTLKQVDHMTGLIQNLVMIARSQEQEKGGILQEVDATKVLEETADTFVPVAQQSGKTLVKELDPGIVFFGEEGDLRQLSTLLLDNAIKYCDENGQIQVCLGRKGRGQVRLVVSNSYAAGKDTDYHQFFDRFYRQDKSHNIDQGGYGIGLSIVESLVRKYRGDVTASWKDGTISFTCLLRNGG